MPNNATPTPPTGRGPDSEEIYLEARAEPLVSPDQERPSSPDELTLQSQVDRLDDLLAGIEALIATHSAGDPTVASAGFKAWADANYHAINGAPRSDADQRYSDLLDEIEAACPAVRDLVHELDEVVGRRLCNYIDHAAAASWDLLGGRGR